MATGSSPVFSMAGSIAAFGTQLALESANAASQSASAHMEASAASASAVALGVVATAKPSAPSFMSGGISHSDARANLHALELPKAESDDSSDSDASPIVRLQRSGPGVFASSEIRGKPQSRDSLVHGEIHSPSGGLSSGGRVALLSVGAGKVEPLHVGAGADQSDAVKDASPRSSLISVGSDADNERSPTSSQGSVIHSPSGDQRSSFTMALATGQLGGFEGVVILDTIKESDEEGRGSIILPGAAPSQSVSLSVRDVQVLVGLEKKDAKS